MFYFLSNRIDINKYDIAQFALGKISNAHISFISAYTNPFMVFGVLQIFGKIHCNVFWWANIYQNLSAYRFFLKSLCQRDTGSLIFFYKFDELFYKTNFFTFAVINQATPYYERRNANDFRRCQGADGKSY